MFLLFLGILILGKVIEYVEKYISNSPYSNFQWILQKLGKLSSICQYSNHGYKCPPVFWKEGVI